MAMRHGLKLVKGAAKACARYSNVALKREFQTSSRVVAPFSRMNYAFFSTSADDNKKENMSMEDVVKMADAAIKDPSNDPKDDVVLSATFTPPSKEESTADDKREFQAETKQLLEIVTHSIYTDKEVFLRELISNASDALEKCRHVQVSGTKINNPEEPLDIQIYIDSEKGTITIQDTGIGMTKEEMQSNLGVIARSGSKQFLKKAIENNEGGDIKNNLIGHFGVGFYSAFMVADHVEVYSHSATENQTYCWTSTGSGDYSIVKAGDMKRGTSIVLYLTDAQKKFADSELIERIIKKYSNFVNFPILLNGKTVNTVQALWTMDKNSITDDQYKDFYHYIGQGFDDPYYRLHFSADAPIELKALFFVGTIQTETMGLGRMEPGVSLYSRKVLIENRSKKLLPDWMRFVKGVVDSEDIPLNLSREGMQDSALIARIRKILTKRFLRFLQDQRKNDYEKYLGFWTQYNHFLKEGAVQDYENRNDISSLLLFDSSKVKDEKLTTLDQYIERCPENQKEIYYMNIPERKYADESPYFEVFKKKDIEVLFVYTPLDDFVTTNIREYKGKQFVAVQNANLKLDEDSVKSENGLSEKEAAELATWMQTTLGEKVKTVKITHRLSDSPALLSDVMNSSYRRLMRLMAQSRGEMPKSLPLEPLTLEINPNHEIMSQLYKMRTEKPLVAQAVTQQLFDNCLITADLLDDPRAILPRLNSILLYSLGGNFKPIETKVETTNNNNNNNNNNNTATTNSTEAPKENTEETKTTSA